MMDGCWLFGAGKKGRDWLKRFREFGVVPTGFLDNSKSLHGSMCEGVMIHNPNKIKLCQVEQIFITCKEEAGIYKQLQELGFPEHKIVYGDHNILNHLLYYLAKKNMPAIPARENCDEQAKERILFDLQNGMVLGGVESWSYELAKTIAGMGYQGLYLTTDAAQQLVKDDTFPAYTFLYQQMENDGDKIKACVQKISENLPCTIICNFPQFIFWSACIAKRLYPNQVRVVAVEHSDDPLYYEAYSLWQRDIDRYMVISLRMEQKLIAYGVDKNKICRLSWKVPCRERLERSWYKEGTYLQIGYAGRVTIRPKRADLFPTLAMKLKEKNIVFKMNIVGTGDYYERLKQRVKEEKLQEYIVCIGYIDRKEISSFWTRQDIMFSCSEWEGHSISQSEAMAEGVVPVITDVSGAEDDIIDGYNGFVVDVGDIESLAERIRYLYHNKEKIEQMGKNAHDMIYSRQKHMNQTDFWRKLMDDIWK